MLSLFFSVVQAQNILEKKILAENLHTVSINGNQIFSISISTSKTDYISITSTLDGEYQNQFQIVTVPENDVLNLSLEHLSFSDIADDKRNAHKVVAATLVIDVPEHLNIHILSDIGSANLNGNFNSVSIELAQGLCNFKGNASAVSIKTIDGNIKVITQYARIQASSNHGKVTLDKLHKGNSIWKLRSINGNITVAKLE